MDGMRFNPSHDIGLSPKQRAKMQENMDIFRKKGLNPAQKTGHTTSVFDPETGRTLTQQTSGEPLLKLKGVDYRYNKQFLGEF